MTQVERMVFPVGTQPGTYVEMTGTETHGISLTVVANGKPATVGMDYWQWHAIKEVFDSLGNLAYPEVLVPQEYTITCMDGEGQDIGTFTQDDADVEGSQYGVYVVIPASFVPEGTVKLRIHKLRRSIVDERQGYTGREFDPVERDHEPGTAIRLDPWRFS